MCGESDASSDFTKGSSTESGARACPCTGGPDADSNVQILQNKEETLRVQAESLRVAEGRIATLSARNDRLREQLEEKVREILSMRRSVKSGVDIGLTVDKEFLRSLRDDLSVTEELYRESFYESAKREEALDVLKKSYLDVRMMDNTKGREIERLRRLVISQRCSLDKCQEIGLEVETLKAEIWNFLNHNNNDSGMWERSEESLTNEVGEELQEIMQQLFHLRDILLDGCSCERDHEILKRTNDLQQMRIDELNQRIRELERVVSERDTTIIQCQEQIRGKEIELNRVREDVSKLEAEHRASELSLAERTRVQLEIVQVALNERTSELERAQCTCKMQELALADLQEQLQRTELVLQEHYKLRNDISIAHREMSSLRTELTDSGAREAALEERLRRLERHYKLLEDSYREKAVSANYLQRELCVATQRGGELCAESRRVLAGLRAWIERMRNVHKKQQAKIKEKTLLIHILRKNLEESQRGCDNTSVSESADRTSESRPTRQRRAEEDGSASERRGSGVGRRAGGRQSIGVDEMADPNGEKQSVGTQEGQDLSETKSRRSSVRHDSRGGQSEDISETSEIPCTKSLSRSSQVLEGEDLSGTEPRRLSVERHSREGQNEDINESVEIPCTTTTGRQSLSRSSQVQEGEDLSGSEPRRSIVRRNSRGQSEDIDETAEFPCNTDRESFGLPSRRIKEREEDLIENEPRLSRVGCLSGRQREDKKERSQLPCSTARHSSQSSRRRREENSSECRSSVRCRRPVGGQSEDTRTPVAGHNDRWPSRRTLDEAEDVSESKLRGAMMRHHSRARQSCRNIDIPCPAAGRRESRPSRQRHIEEEDLSVSEPCCSRYRFVSSAGRTEPGPTRAREREEHEDNSPGRRGARKKSRPSYDDKRQWYQYSLGTSPDPPVFCLDRHTLPREMSPTEELVRRVERLQDALTSGGRRWGAREA